MNHTCLRTMRSINRTIRTTVNTHLEVVCGVQRSNHIWYVWNEKCISLFLTGIWVWSGPTWLILLKNVDTIEGFWRRTSSPVSSIILTSFFFLRISLSLYCIERIRMELKNRVKVFLDKILLSWFSLFLFLSANAPKFRTAKSAIFSTLFTKDRKIRQAI